MSAACNCYQLLYDRTIGFRILTFELGSCSKSQAQSSGPIPQATPQVPDPKPPLRSQTLGPMTQVLSHRPKAPGPRCQAPLLLELGVWDPKLLNLRLPIKSL